MTERSGSDAEFMIAEQLERIANILVGMEGDMKAIAQELVREGMEGKPKFKKVLK